jgi:hypothetical protein|nr:MAG TPA: putative ATP-dependent serine protease [Caudoviricetes sp.]
MERAYSPSEILRKKIPSIPFEGVWRDAFGEPGRTGVWIIWGESANGKSSFAMQLARELTKHGKVAYNSLEESLSLSFQNNMRRCRMEEARGRFLVLDREPIEALTERLKRQRSPDFVIIDSLQYTGMNYKEYKKLKEQFPNKLFVFVSHADGEKPKGATAVSVQYDADMKILVQGYRAICKGRFIPEAGKHYSIWAEAEAKYWGIETEQDNEPQY